MLTIVKLAFAVALFFIAWHNIETIKEEYEDFLPGMGDWLMVALATISPFLIFKGWGIVVTIAISLITIAGYIYYYLLIDDYNKVSTIYPSVAICLWQFVIIMYAATALAPAVALAICILVLVVSAIFSAFVVYVLYKRIFHRRLRGGRLPKSSEMFRLMLPFVVFLAVAIFIVKVLASAA